MRTSSWMFWLAGIILVSSACLSSKSQAQDAPMCNRMAIGQATCLANVQCECIYDRGGAMTGVPEGYRWDCSILRPRCEEVPATIIEYRGTPPSYPAAVAIERTDRSVNVGQDNTNANGNSNANTNTNSNN